MDKFEAIMKIMDLDEKGKSVYVVYDENEAKEFNEYVKSKGFSSNRYWCTPVIRSSDAYICGRRVNITILSEMVTKMEAKEDEKVIEFMRLVLRPTFNIKSKFSSRKLLVMMYPE